MNEFVIDFAYQGATYTGLVTPKTIKGEILYAVRLESENQELYLDIFANPCGENKMDWCFKELPGEGQMNDYDKEFLQEIGEAIEKYQIGLPADNDLR